MSWIDDWLEKNPGPKPQARPVGVDLSYSQVRSFLECPWQYKLRYRDRWRTPHSPASALGVSIHRALEAYLRSGGGTLDELRRAYEENWVHEGFSDPAIQMEWYRRGEEILAVFHAQNAASDSTIEHLEREFFFPLGPHMVRGIIDRVDRLKDGSIEVIDYKTQLEARAEESVKGDLQLMMYGLGCEEGLGIVPQRLSLYYVALGKKVSVPYDREQAEDVLRLLERVGDCLAIGKKFPPDTSFCPNCGLRDRCTMAVAA